MKDSTIPWEFGFQCNERYLRWDDSAQRRLLKMAVADKLGQDVEWVEAQLGDLAALLPDMVGRLERLKADLLARLVADTPAIAAKLIALRAVFPSADLSALAAAWPPLLLDMSTEAAAVQLRALAAALPPGADVEGVVAREPRLLAADVGFVVQELRRLGVDPGAMLLRNPGLVLNMEQAGLPSSLEGDLSGQMRY